eukprot:1157349-Pelagomonas_calceolata.AAC.7
MGRASATPLLLAPRVPLHTGAKGSKPASLIPLSRRPRSKYRMNVSNSSTSSSTSSSCQQGLNGHLPPQVLPLPNTMQPCR